MALLRIYENHDGKSFYFCAINKLKTFYYFFGFQIYLFHFQGKKNL